MNFHSVHTCVISAIVECMTSTLRKNDILVDIINLKDIEENCTDARRRAESILANDTNDKTLQVVICNAMGAYHVGVASVLVSVSNKTVSENPILYCEIDDAVLQMKLSQLIPTFQKSDHNS
jgi:hypothetical protein